MMSAALVLSVQLATTPLLAAAPPATDEAELTLDVTPAILLADQDIRAVVRVRPDSGNRMLMIALDGEFYSSTERSLDGERAARTYEFYFRKLPAGQYLLQAKVEDTKGRVRKVERQITVLGEIDADAIDLSRRRR